MRPSWTTIRAHGWRAPIAVALAVLVIASLGLVARAELGDTSTSAEPTSTTTTPNGNGDDNVAVAVNTKDGSEVYAVRLKVVMTDNDTVDAGNAAVAAASCNDCTTVAIAIEGVLVTGDAETVVPVNLALAVNTECTNCQTLAAAYQYVTSTDGRVRITGEGRQTIASLRQELNTLRTRDLSLAQIAAEVDRIAGEFYTVLKTQVVPIGRTQGEFPARGATPSPFPEETTVTSTASAPPATSSESTSASPTESPTDTSSPSPSPTASP